MIRCTKPPLTTQYTGTVFSAAGGHCESGNNICEAHETRKYLSQDGIKVHELISIQYHIATTEKLCYILQACSERKQYRRPLKGLTTPIKVPDIRALRALQGI